MSLILRHLTWDEQVAARTLWAECRGEPMAGQLAVAHVLLTRLKDGRWGKTLAEVCLARKQFSSWNDSDPQRSRMAALRDDDPALLVMVARLTDAQQHPESDPTGGANHYYAVTIPQPEWAGKMTLLCQIGHHRFYTDKVPVA